MNFRKAAGSVRVRGASTGGEEAGDGVWAGPWLTAKRANSAAFPKRSLISKMGYPPFKVVNLNGRYFVNLSQYASLEQDAAA